MNYFPLAQDFIAASKRISDLDTLAEAFLKRIGQMGFDSFACASLVDPASPPDNFVYVNYYPEKWMHHYLEHQYAQCDPVLQVAMHTSVPFRWSDQSVRADLSRKQKKLFQDASEAGLDYGFAVPIHSRLDFSAMVTVVGDTEEISDDAANIVHLMGVYLYDAAKRISRKTYGEKGTRLTGRERECLRWAAVGKSDWEIGEILGVSKNTVHFHVENAKKKLHVTTRVQAVTEALLSSEIGI